MPPHPPAILRKHQAQPQAPHPLGSFGSKCLSSSLLINTCVLLTTITPCQPSVLRREGSATTAKRTHRHTGNSSPSTSLRYCSSRRGHSETRPS